MSKLGPAGRYGVRYGRSIKQKVIDVEKRQRGWHKCPYCNKARVKRVSAGIWHCRSCKARFTGRAYEIV